MRKPGTVFLYHNSKTRPSVLITLSRNNLRSKIFPTQHFSLTSTAHSGRFIPRIPKSSVPPTHRFALAKAEDATKKLACCISNRIPAGQTPSPTILGFSEARNGFGRFRFLPYFSGPVPTDLQSALETKLNFRLMGTLA